MTWFKTQNAKTKPWQQEKIGKLLKNIAYVQFSAFRSFINSVSFAKTLARSFIDAQSLLK